MELNSKNIKKLLLLSLGVAIIFCFVINISSVFAFLGNVFRKNYLSLGGKENENSM